MNERAVTIKAGAVNLAGTLVVPESNHLIVCLMIHGSGPLDRDENMSGQRLDIFNAIAEHFFQHGIASLRYDKRGCGQSSGNFLEAGHHELVEDAAACVDYLVSRELTPLSRIVLLGHSEGTIISAQLAARFPGLGGLILLCPFIQGVEGTLISQAAHIAEAAQHLPGLRGVFFRFTQRLSGGTLNAQRRLITRLKNSNKRTFRSGLQRIPAQSLRELMDLDLRSIYEHVATPTLIVAGGKDVQCRPGDVPQIEACIQASVTAVVIPDLTHILRKDPGVHTIFSYASLLDKPLDVDVTRLLVENFPVNRAIQSR